MTTIRRGPDDCLELASDGGDNAEGWTRRVPPPPRIDGARVLEWAWSEDPFGEVFDSEGRLIAVVRGLALCRYDNSSQIYRFTCDANWDCQQDAVYSSIDEAKAHLPAQYRRVEPTWRHAM